MFLLPIIISCSLLTGLAKDAVLGKQGGINTELVVGDKEQVLGINQEVKASSVGKVVGNNDNSVATGTVDTLRVSNTNYPHWLIIVLLVGNVAFLCAPTPTTMFKYFKGRTK